MSEVVLLADDDPTVRMLMREILQGQLGLEVVEVKNGDEAWAKLDGGLAPALCILDEKMPKMGGLDLLAKMRADPRFTQQRVMLCSAVIPRSSVLEGVRLRVDAIILKPFRVDDFSTQVRTLLQKPRATLAPALEPAQDALKRLGIGMNVYLRLLSVLNQDIQSFVRAFLTSTASSNEDLQSSVSAIVQGLSAQTAPVNTNEDFQLRVCAIKGAVSSLGAPKLIELFSNLEKIGSYGSPRTAPILKAIEQERLRVLDAKAELERNLPQE